MEDHLALRASCPCLVFLAEWIIVLVSTFRWCFATVTTTGRNVCMVTDDNWTVNANYRLQLAEIIVFPEPVSAGDPPVSLLELLLKVWSTAILNGERD